MSRSALVPLVLCPALALLSACGIIIPGLPTPCPDVANLCPNLTCADGFVVNEAGCTLCECKAPVQPPIDAGPGGDAGPTVNCFSDLECVAGEFCDTLNFCDAPGVPGGVAIACMGRCVDPNGPLSPNACNVDSECRPGDTCHLDQVTCGGGAGAGDRPACPPDDPSCTSGGSGGVAACTGTCGLAVGRGCHSDDECGGARCDTTNFCDQDPACPFCDSCLGRCVDLQACDASTPCRQGETCDVVDFCLSAPSCDGQDFCGGACFGACVIGGAGCDGAVLDAIGQCIAPDGAAAPLECCQRSTTCSSDADCPNGFCEGAISQPEPAPPPPCDPSGPCSDPPAPPPPPQSVCTFLNCDDGSAAMCPTLPPTCDAGQTAAVREGCFSCVDARTCQ